VKRGKRGRQHVSGLMGKKGEKNVSKVPCKVLTRFNDTGEKKR